MLKQRRAPRVISIMALVFGPLGMLVSYAMYDAHAPWNEIPLLVMALAVGVLEIAAAVSTLSHGARARQLFLAYGVLALVLVIADGYYLAFMPPEPDGGGAYDTLLVLMTGVIGFLSHLVWSIASLAWTSIVLCLAAAARSRRMFPA